MQVYNKGRVRYVYTRAQRPSSGERHWRYLSDRVCTYVRVCYMHGGDPADVRALISVRGLLRTAAYVVQTRVLDEWRINIRLHLPTIFSVLFSPPVFSVSASTATKSLAICAIATWCDHRGSTRHRAGIPQQLCIDLPNY